MKKRIVSIITIFAVLVCNSVLPSFAVQIENNNNAGINNLIILSDDFENLVYTYQENGKKYKVAETVNAEFTEICGSKFVWDEISKNFELVDKYQIVLDYNSTPGYLNYTILSGEGAGSYSIGISNGVEFDNGKRVGGQREATEQLVGPPQGSGTYWRYINKYKNDTSIQKHTLAIVAAAIFGAMGYYAAGPIGAGATSGMAVLAGIIVESNISVVYFNHHVWFDYVTSTSNLPMYEYMETYAYADKDRTQFIEMVTYYGEIDYH